MARVFMVRYMLAFSTTCLALRSGSSSEFSPAVQQPDIDAFGAFLNVPKGWTTEGNIGHSWWENQCIAKFIADHFLEEFQEIRPGMKPSVVELGAGLGKYARYMKEVRDFNLKECCDGNPQTHNATKGLCRTRNIAQPQIDIPKADFAYSLEVGEHIPAEFQDVFLDNLDRANRFGMVLSWAPKSEANCGGDVHVNCRNKDELIEIIEKRGYQYMPADTERAREIGGSCPCTIGCGVRAEEWHIKKPMAAPWFAESMLVFKRE